jgi:hypothetical protein
MRLDILPTGYIDPREERAVRDLMRKRLQLVRHRVTHMLSAQNQLWRSTGVNTTTKLIKQADFSLLNLVEDRHMFQSLLTMDGVGDILGLTIALEIGDIRRFPRVSNFSSYCRCVDSSRLSNGKKKGDNNRKNGNKYLSGAFIEAAHSIIRHNKTAHRFYQRKRAQKNGALATKALAHKLARAAYYMIRDREPFKLDLLFR